MERREGEREREREREGESLRLVSHVLPLPMIQCFDRTRYLCVQETPTLH